MTGPAQAEVDRLNADLEDTPWHVWLSTDSPATETRPFCPGGRVWAVRSMPCHPHIHVNRSNRMTPCGETVDTDTPAGMRKLLEERS